ncbi:hypothetical protein [Moraxella cuniculi]|nr:hypothetical protein [Moraxella cuniculi]
MIPFVMLFLVLQEGEFLAGMIAFAILALGTFLMVMEAKQLPAKISKMP